MGHGSETPNPQQDSSPRRCQKRAHRCSRNSIFGTAKARQYKANIPVQAIQGIESRPRCLDEPEYRGKALWSTVEHGYETPDPQQDSSPRRCQKRAQPLNTRQYKVQSNLQGIQGIEGKAIDVWMNRNTVETPCGARWGMVAKHRIPSRIQAQGGARNVRRDDKAIQGIQGIHGKAIDVWMDRPVPWKSLGWETPDAQQDSSPRRRQRPAQRCSRNSIFRTAKYK